MINFKVGILGAGHISEIIADTLNKLDSFEPYAIASRDIERANAFGDKFNIEKRYGSYEELVNDPEVELIYIATTNNLHAEHAKLCINAGKACLVEKPFSYNTATANEVFKLAEEKGVFCGEAMWIRFLPLYQALMDILKRNVIGRVNCLQCSLGYDLRKKERMVKPELAGGALLDLGVYPLNLMKMVYGKYPELLTSSVARLETGVDAEELLNFNYTTGQNANAVVSMMYKADNNARIYGTSGYIEIININNPEKINIYKGDGELLSDIPIPDRQITGYEYEFILARDAIILGKTETNIMPHADTLTVLGIMDTLRSTWNLRFPMETEDSLPRFKPNGAPPMPPARNA